MAVGRFRVESDWNYSVFTLVPLRLTESGYYFTPASWSRAVLAYRADDAALAYFL